jgi:hypothetical protein
MDETWNRIIEVRSQRRRASGRLHWKPSKDDEPECPNALCDLEQMYWGPRTGRMKKSVWTTVSGVYHGRSGRNTDDAGVVVEAQANVEFYRSRECILGEARWGRQSQNLPNLWEEPK